MNGDKPHEQDEQAIPSDEEVEQLVMDTARDLLQEQEAEEFWSRMYETQEHLPMVTDIKRGEIGMYKSILWFADMFGQDWLREMVDVDLALRVSIDRKGRKEAVYAMTGQIEQKMRGTRILERLFKRKG